MKSVAKKSVTNKNPAPGPVSAQIKRAAARAGITPSDDHAQVTMMRGDVARAVSELKLAFDDVLEAALVDEPEARDLLIMGALGRLRNARNMIGGAL